MRKEASRADQSINSLPRARCGTSIVGAALGYNDAMSMRIDNFQLQMNVPADETGECTARLGAYTGTGATPTTALMSLTQRIAGLHERDAEALWAGGRTEISARSAE